MVVSPNWWYLFGGPYNKDHSILGSMLGSPLFRQIPIKGLMSGTGRMR